MLLPLFAGIQFVSAQTNESGWYKTELHFEHSGPHVKTISESEWKYFSEEYIFPCFPEGYTVYFASRNTLRKKDKKPVPEKLCIVVFVYDDASAKDYCISSIVRHFKESFPKLSLTRIDYSVHAEKK
jgi:hypothetical protein